MGPQTLSLQLQFLASLLSWTMQEESNLEKSGSSANFAANGQTSSGSLSTCPRFTRWAKHLHQICVASKSVCRQNSSTNTFWLQAFWTIHFELICKCPTLRWWWLLIAASYRASSYIVGFIAGFVWNFSLFPRNDVVLSNVIYRVVFVPYGRSGHCWQQIGSFYLFWNLFIFRTHLWMTPSNGWNWIRFKDALSLDLAVSFLTLLYFFMQSAHHIPEVI